MRQELHLTLVRHGATNWNEGGRWQGWSDNPLGPLGESQARELAGVLRGQSFDRVYSSDLLRAVQTARLALPDWPLIQEKRLREFNFGEYDGLTVPEMQAHPVYDHWQADAWAHRLPGGESLSDVAERMQGWLTEVTAEFSARPAGGRIIAFSHSIAIRTLLVSLFGTALEPQPNYPIPYRERLGNAQFVTLRKTGGQWTRS